VLCSGAQIPTSAKKKQHFGKQVKQLEIFPYFIPGGLKSGVSDLGTILLKDRF